MVLVILLNLVQIESKLSWKITKSTLFCELMNVSWMDLKDLQEAAYLPYFLPLIIVADIRMQAQCSRLLNLMN